MLEKLEGTDRLLVVVALQALHRERATAYQAACTVCYLAVRPKPDVDLFGLDEVSDALRRTEAGPLR